MPDWCFTVCVSGSQLHYVTWAKVSFFSHFHGLSPSGSLSFSYVNNIISATVTVMEVTFKKLQSGFSYCGLNRGSVLTLKLYKKNCWQSRKIGV